MTGREKQLYRWTQEISDCFFDTWGAYRAMVNLFCREVDGLSLYSNHKEDDLQEGVSLQTAHTLLTHVARRTFPFRKLVELISPRQIVDGVENLGTGPVGLHRTQAKKGISALVADGALIRIRLTSSDAVYGLNLPKMLGVLHGNWKPHKKYTHVEKGKKALERLHQAFYYQDQSDKNLEQWSLTVRGEMFEMLGTVKEALDQGGREAVLASLQALALRNHNGASF